MPNTNDTTGQVLTPATASGLNRRRLRKHLLDTCLTPMGGECQSHVDGSVTVRAKRSQAGDLAAFIAKVQTAITAFGYTPRILKSSNPAGGLHEVTFASEETVAQGMCGAHFYRGTGQFALRSDRAQVYLAGGIDPLAQQVEAPTTEEPTPTTEEPTQEDAPAPVAEEPAAQVDVATERAASTQRRRSRRAPRAE